MRTNTEDRNSASALRPQIGFAQRVLNTFFKLWKPHPESCQLLPMAHRVQTPPTYRIDWYDFQGNVLEWLGAASNYDAAKLLFKFYCEQDPTRLIRWRHGAAVIEERIPSIDAFPVVRNGKAN